MEYFIICCLLGYIVHCNYVLGKYMQDVTKEIQDVNIVIDKLGATPTENKLEYIKSRLKQIDKGAR